jgi:hypothetical protein
MININDIDTQDIVDVVTSSDGSLALAAERLGKKLGVPYGTIKEYDLQVRISTFDVQTADNVAARLRTLLTLKLYELIVLATDQLKMTMTELRPAELARTHTSLINSFASLTSPATKVTFDFNREIEDLAREFPDISVDDIRSNIKEMEQRVKSIRAVK